MENSHGKLSSRLGFILISAGCAIGVGNVWKFPYITGENGGGAFLLIYFLFLIIMGLPILTVEFAIGRRAQKSPIKMYQAIVPEKKAWHLHGKVAFVGNIMLMMFYTTVCGWMFNYFLKTARGDFNPTDGTLADSDYIANTFGNTTGSAGEMILFALITVVAGAIVCSLSLEGGLEKVTKVMMIALIAIMIGLAIYGFTMDGAGEALSFYLKPDFSKINIDVVIAAMNQAFFTLSIGLGSMAIFGSYIGRDRSLLGESANIILLDTLVAFVAGLIIFPACFTYNVAPDAGPNLIFVTLPSIFANMDGGRIIGSLFFLFMSFAAFSTVIAVFENIAACVRDIHPCSRKKSSLITGVIVGILSLPCALGFNVWSDVTIIGGNIMDFEDFIVSNILLPGGALIMTLFCSWKFGWGYDNFIEEANAGEGIKVKKGFEFYMKYILPSIIILLIIIGLVQKFSA